MGIAKAFRVLQTESESAIEVQVSDHKAADHRGGWLVQEEEG